MAVQYVTRNRDKAMKLFVALTEAGFTSTVGYNQNQYGLVTVASEEEFAVARASINIPSSSSSVMPNPDTLNVSDYMPSGWADFTDGPCTDKNCSCGQWSKEDDIS